MIEEITGILAKAKIKGEIIVVDDDSPDGTAELVQPRKVSPCKVKVIIRKKDRGLAKSILEGIRRSSGEIVVVMDTDFNHDPKEIPKLVAELNRSDLVIGSRYIKGGGMENKLRYWLSFLFNIYVRVILGVSIRDNLSGYFAARRAVLQGLPLEEIFNGFGEYFMRLVYYTHRKNYKILESPVFYKNRRCGESKSRFFRMFLRYTSSALSLKMKSLRFRFPEAVFYPGLFVFIILLAQLPTMLHFFHTPPGYYYPLLDRVSFSDFYYLSLIRYGMGDSWLLQIPYVIAPHKPSLIQVFFVLLGKIVNVTHTGPAEIFTIFKVLGGLVFLTAALLFFKSIMPKEKIKTVFIFFLFAQPIFLDDFGNWIWHFGEATRRISLMPPHYTLGKGLAILSLLLFISSTSGKYFARPRGVFIALLSGLVAFTAGLIYPPPVFILLFSLTAAWAVFTLIRKPLAAIQRVPVKKISLFLLGLILPLIILKLELSKGYPWSRWNEVELGWNDPSMNFELGYMKSTGVLLALAIWGFWGRKGFWDIFIIIWGFSAFLLFPFADLLRLGKFRFIEGAQIVPLAILAFWGFELFLKKFGNIFKQAFLFIFISYFLVITSLTVYLSTKSLWPYFTNVYFQPEELSAFRFLENNAKENAIVMTDVFPSNYLPAFVKIRTILGFSDSFIKYSDFEQERETIEAILKGNLEENKTKEYVLSRNVSYVYRNKSIFGGKIPYPSFMKMIYQNANYDIYKIIL